MDVKIKIILPKIKIKLSNAQAESLSLCLQFFLQQEMNSSFDADFVHMSWLSSLKQIAVKLLDKDLDKGKEVKLSLSEAQYMALFPFAQEPAPHPTRQVDMNGIFDLLFKAGMEEGLINVKGGRACPLIGHMQKLNAGDDYEGY